MKLAVKPAALLKGQIDLPSSKSYSIRAFLIAACGGTSTIINPSDCDDAKVAIQVASKLGATITRDRKNRWKTVAFRRKIKPTHINVGESATVLRFLLPLLAFKGSRVTVVGEGTLKPRPNYFLTEVLRKMGITIIGRGQKESVPIRIYGGRLRGGKVTIDGGLSSQFISALLAAVPALQEDTRLTITGKHIVSATYIVMTELILRKAGIIIKKVGQRTFFIKGNQKFKGLKTFRVPSDYGLAAFFLAAAALVRSDLILKGHLKEDFIQSDAEILSFLRRMGARFKKTERSIKMTGPFELKGGDFSLKDCPDLVPIMSVMALFAKGRTRLYNIGHVRAKESDRISTLRKELLKVGANIVERKNELIIYPKPLYEHNVLLNPHHDHRLAMSFAILGLKLAVRIRDIECTSKSYPQFVGDLKRIGARVSLG